MDLPLGWGSQPQLWESSLTTVRPLPEVAVGAAFLIWGIVFEESQVSTTISFPSRMTVM